MKSIEQLLKLSQNKYYKFTTEEQKELDDFLATQSGPRSPQESNSSDSYLKTPAIAHNKNRFEKETGEVPTTNAL